jgi:hypothetical protein
MMVRFFWLAIAVALTIAGSARASDLAAIDRSLRKEPKYESNNPQYCLLVFGPEAKIRVWVVVDGDVLYLDRNGNGDLTEPGERIAKSDVDRGEKDRQDIEVTRTFEVYSWMGGVESILTCGPEVKSLYIFQLVPRADWHDQAWVRRFQEKPFDVAVTTKSGGRQRAGLRFAAKAQDAPILPFDGPRRLALFDGFGPILFRRGETCDLFVQLCAVGLNATVRTDADQAPEEVHPVADIEFPPGRPDGDPIRLRVELKERC